MTSFLQCYYIYDESNGSDNYSDRESDIGYLYHEKGSLVLIIQGAKRLAEC